MQAAEMIASAEWDVRRETVLELGAGAGLPSIVAALSGAGEVRSVANWVTFGCSLNILTGCDIRLPFPRTIIQYIRKFAAQSYFRNNPATEDLSPRTQMGRG